MVTAVEVGSGRRSKVLSDFTFAVRASEDDPTLLNVGKAYSGLTDAEIAELSEWFRAHTLQEFAHGKVRTVEPQVVIEVTFDRVQLSARHKSGYALRFPAHPAPAPRQTRERNRHARNREKAGRKRIMTYQVMLHGEGMIEIFKSNFVAPGNPQPPS